jgi:outer membrane protein TolC
MEYLPNYALSGEFDHILQEGAEPLPGVTEVCDFGIGLNIPPFLWCHHREDVTSAQHTRQAARYSLNSVVSQTGAPVAPLDDSTQFACESAQEFKGALIPLADKKFRVALIAYQTGKVDFPTLSSALQNTYAARLTYLQDANQYSGGAMALEQAMGVRLPT